MPQRRLGWLLGLVVLAALLALPRRALAYPWMLRHDYTACATCHTDPSGGGLLSAYGRVQAATLLSSRLGLPPNEEEPGKYKDFLFGAVELPDALDAQAWLRSAYIVNLSDFKVVDNRYLFMRGDVGAHLALGAFRASGMLGLATSDSPGYTQQAWVTASTTGPNLVSREHWVGVSLADDAVLLRAGRLDMPFGLRNLEHTSWVRAATQTDTNEQQQHGVAVAYTGEKIRAEAMAVLGNYQIAPDAYRERGYSAYAEYAIEPHYAVGVSSSIVHAEADVLTRRPDFRQGHGLFARLVPVKPLALLAEGDVIVKSVRLDNPSVDGAGFLQADFEAVQGLHLLGTGELLTESRQHATLVGGWLSVWWFAFAHMDARLDLIERTAPVGPATTTVLLQLHGFL